MFADINYESVVKRFIYLPFPDNLKEHNEKEHLFIVLSDVEANNVEPSFVGVMITSSGTRRDDYSFNLSDSMFEQPLGKSGSHVRMHLLTLCVPKDIVGRRVNVMKEFYFNRLMETIGELVFNYDFKRKQ